MPNKIYIAAMYGQGGQPVDTILTGDGLGKLANRLLAYPNITCELFTWNDAYTIALKIKKLPATTKIVIGGSSLGANETPRACLYLAPKPVDFIFGMQPSLAGVHNLVPANVQKALCFYNPIPFFFLGGYKWQKSNNNNKTTMLSSYSFAIHPGDNIESTQDYIIDEIKKLF